jgi:ubiquinone/menaquinone biosynthesis C-methylase UbiE
MFEARNNQLSPDIHPVLDSKQWENALTLRTLRDFQKLEPNAKLICIGAGTEETLFYLGNQVSLVVAADLYSKETVWSDVAPRNFLKNPNSYNPYQETQNLIGISADAMDLPLPDKFFDAAFSCGSIEHFGGIENARLALMELSRVLKIGGIASISTEYRLRGPNNKNSWGTDTYLFTWKEIEEELIQGTGFELVDKLQNLEVDAETLSTRQNLPDFLNLVKNNPREAHFKDAYPNLVMYHEGFLFCSIHFALRKTSDPVIRNSSERSIDSYISKLATRKTTSNQVDFGNYRGVKSLLVELSVVATNETRMGLNGFSIRMLGHFLNLGIKGFIKVKKVLTRL